MTFVSCRNPRLHLAAAPSVGVGPGCTTPHRFPLPSVSRIAAAVGVALFACLTPSCAPSQHSLVEWRYNSADAGSSRFAPIGEIDSTNVADLRMVWRWRAPDLELHRTRVLENDGGDNQCTPLMVGGTLYLSTPLNTVVALDPESGEEIWRFENPDVWHISDYMGTHRGVAYWSDGARERILFGTGTAYLYSLDAKTGLPDPEFGDGGRIDLLDHFDRPVWRGALSVTSPPIVCRDVLVTGWFASDWYWDGAPPEKTPPGAVFGFDVRTGKRLWTFHSIPREGEFGVDTWENDSWKTAARVNVWTILSADEELGYIYLPFGNPDNEYYGGARHGDNLYTSSLVCLEARTGKRVWHYQTMRHGLWNLDLPHAAMLVDVEVDGKPVKAVAQLTKQAFCFVLDRVTGEPLWPVEQRRVPASTVPGERMPDTQPFPTRPAPYDRQGLTEEDIIDFTPEIRRETIEFISEYDYGPLYTPPSTRGTIMVPGLIGGATWWNGAVHPEKGWIYVSSQTKPGLVEIEENDEHPHGFTGDSRDVRGPRGLPLTKPPYGRIVAIDLNTGDHRWMRPIGKGPVDHPELRELDLPPLGSATRIMPMTTRTLLFAVTDQPFDPRRWRYHERHYIDPEPYLLAFDLDDGRLIHRLELPANGSGPPMSYAIGGRQYIVVPLGDEDTPAEFAAYAIPRKDEKLPMQPTRRTDAGHPLFYEAVRAVDSGDTTALSDLLAKHPGLARARGYLDPHYKYPGFRGASLLHLLAGEPLHRGELKGDVGRMAQQLLDAGADPNAVTVDSFATLSLVYDSRQTGWLGIREELLRLLLDAGADPDERRGYLLWAAVRNQEDDLAELLLSHGATFDLRTAAGMGRMDVLAMFFREDGSLTPDAHSGFVPHFPATVDIPVEAEDVLTEAVTLAARGGHADALEFLLDRGADVHSLSVRFWWRGDKGATPLHHAAGNARLGAVRLLLGRGADPNMPDQWGSTPLDWARWADDDAEDKQEVIRLLEEAAAERE